MFLETITFLGNDALIPIEKIKYINTGYSERSYKIIITGYDGDWVECFDTDEKMKIRYEMIKKIIKAK